MQDGRLAETREIVLFDRTSSGLTLQLWDKAIICQAAEWKPRETSIVIFSLLA